MDAKFYILYNPHAGNGMSEAAAKSLASSEKYENSEIVAMTDIKSYSEFFADKTDASVIICGGDGTLNRFVNDIDGIDIDHKLYYYATGSGNDFLHDIGGTRGDAPIELNKYIEGLPKVFVNDKECLFINGVGYGIDGYCCEEGDKIRLKSTKPVNYTSIAIKGLLFHYKCPNAKVTVDGVEYSFKKVWIAPSMNGRFYGGGIMPTPDQDRLSPDGKLSIGLLHSSGRLKTLLVFPSLFKGEHLKHTEMVTVLKGDDITVEFDRPTALQIDGETVLGVTKYRAISRAYRKAELTV
jgi:diacylglycerol kinase family enzyme